MQKTSLCHTQNFKSVPKNKHHILPPQKKNPITFEQECTFDMLRRMANPLSLRNWWLHEYDDEDDYALFQV